jgi:hypothetical protein
VCFEQPEKLVMLFDHVGQYHFQRDELLHVEEHAILVLVHITEANGTLEPILDSRKFDEVDGAVVIADS